MMIPLTNLSPVRARPRVCCSCSRNSGLWLHPQRFRPLLLRGEQRPMGRRHGHVGRPVTGFHQSGTDVPEFLVTPACFLLMSLKPSTVSLADCHAHPWSFMVHN